MFRNTQKHFTKEKIKLALICRLTGGDLTKRPDVHTQQHGVGALMLFKNSIRCFLGGVDYLNIATPHHHLIDYRRCNSIGLR